MKTSDKFKKEKIFSFKPIAATNQTKSGLIKRTATKKEETTQSHPTRTNNSTAEKIVSASTTAHQSIKAIRGSTASLKVSPKGSVGQLKNTNSPRKQYKYGSIGFITPGKVSPPGHYKLTSIPKVLAKLGQQNINKQQKQCVQKEEREQPPSEVNEFVQNEGEEKAKKSRQEYNDKTNKYLYHRFEQEYKPKYVPDAKLKKIQIDQQNREEIKRSLVNVIKKYYPEKKDRRELEMSAITKDNTQKDDKITRSDFAFMEAIGEGGYGKVWKVQHLKTKKRYAMKQMSKAMIVLKKSVQNVVNERRILQELRSGFISNMACAFNDRDNLYLVMDLLTGSDLRYRIGYVTKFTQQETKFIIACIIVAVDYIHRKKIFHRDIKPENLVFDQKGYLRLTDFGIARSENSQQGLDASGTPGYMAPEVLCKQVHSYEVDYYAIGIIAYELMMGKRPYSGVNRQQIRDAILSKQHFIKKNQIPNGWSAEAADFINKLIIRQPTSRLGYKFGTRQLKTHKWFSCFSWYQLEHKKIKSPFKGKDLFIDHNQNAESYSEALAQYKLLQRVESKVDAFSKYYYEFPEQ